MLAYQHLDAFSTFEESVHGLTTDRMAADFLGLALTNTDILIWESGKRKGSYTIQRQRRRYTAAQRKAMKYVEVLHGSIADGSTVRRILAIREQIGNI